MFGIGSLGFHLLLAFFKTEMKSTTCCARFVKFKKWLVGGIRESVLVVLISSVSQGSQSGVSRLWYCVVMVEAEPSTPIGLCDEVISSWEHPQLCFDPQIKMTR